MIAGGRLLSGVFSLDFQLALGIVAVVFVVYTFWGGQISVIRTDFWQLMLFIGGLFVALAFLAASQGPLDSLLKGVPPEHLRFPVSSGFGWYEVLVFYPLIVGLPYVVGPDIYSRVLCARNDQVARKSSLVAALFVIPLSFLLAFFGVLARGQFPGIPAETALPHTLQALIPVGLEGLIVAGFLGAIMSSADTCLISASTILSLNVMGSLRKGSQEHHLRVTRGALLAVGGTAWLVASMQQGIISSLLLGYTVFVGGVVLPTLASFYREELKITPSGALWAIVVGGSAAILGKVQGGTLMTGLLTSGGVDLLCHLLGPQYLSILPIILSFIVMLAVSWIRR
jgi:SSS family solute:Na+ symporter